MILAAAGLLCVAALYVVATALLNRLAHPAAVEPGPALTPAGRPLAPPISILTWNIGYGGMGAESDFVMDKGEQRRPLSGYLVDKNVAGVAAALQGMPSDLILLQEAARPSWNTYGHDVIGGVEKALPEHALAYKADIDTVGVPPPLRVSVGSALLARAPGKVEYRGLTLEPTFEYGAFRKLYRMHLIRFDDASGAPWTVVNVHLSAFDTPEHRIREAQLREVIAFAETEFAAGHHVVVGGDWNLRLAPTEFPHRTAEEFLFWIRDLPEGAAPPGWPWAVDPATPTVRTAHQPYREGENYRLIVDGFLVSPNVALLSVDGVDLAFRFGDHNPVRIEVRAKEQAE